MTPGLAEELDWLAGDMRRRLRAEGVGPMHAWWDVVFDLEAAARGLPTLSALPPDRLAADARLRLGQPPRPGGAA